MPLPTSPSSACILCSLNCGVRLQVEGGAITKVAGDPDHPVSRGYLCQKALRLPAYQDNLDRVTRPLKRREDGTFEPISWDQAISEVAAKLVALRDEHGGGCLAYYGGGGQGNHLGGAYSGALRAAMGTRYLYNSLAQEKTGDFWVNGRLFGKQTCHVSEDLEEAELVLLLGTNPWQAHGIPRARIFLKELAKDPDRTLVVVDPRRTKTAELADLHLQVRPGTDAFLLAAMLGVIVQEGLEDREFLEARTRGFEELATALREVPVDEYSRRAGIAPEVARDLARRLAGASRAAVRVDLGLQHSLHSTLNSYLEKLLFLITGNFGKEGGNNLHSFLLPLIGHSDEEDLARTAVTGMFEISKFFPPNVLPAEVLTDHPGRLRGIVVDSSNPLSSGADTPAYREAFEALELVVVIDVAMSETAQLADYVLPPCTQFEKWEATFFSLHFPENSFHLRAPVLEPAGDTLPEPEIYRRLVVAMGELPERFPVLEAVARLDRRAPRLRLFPLALQATLAMRPAWRPYASLILHETLGATLPDGARAAAVLWAAAHRYAARHGEAVRRAGIEDRGAGLGEALFERFLEARSGMTLSVHEYPDTWKMVRTPDRRVHLAIPEMLAALGELHAELATPEHDEDYPFMLSAGERRAFNALTILRDPTWRRADPEGALRLHPEDAERLGISEGDEVACETHTGSARVRASLDDTVLPGSIYLPHGYGTTYPEDGERRGRGPAINELTAADHCDPLSKTPFHKCVPARLRKV
jgi:anaerobic selenocysteine-containing dehydrogenase